MITRFAATVAVSMFSSALAAAAQSDPVPTAATTSPAASETFNVGDDVMCDRAQTGTFEAGTVRRIDRRPDSPEPTYMVQMNRARGTNLTPCSAAFMKKAR
jgi:hypothetical protein